MGNLADDLMELRKQINADRQNRNVFTVQLKQNHKDNKDQVAAMLSQFNAQRKENHLSDILKDFHGNLSKQVSTLKQTTAQFLEQIQRDMKVKSIQNQSDRLQYISEISQKVHLTLKTFREERYKKAGQLKKDLIKYREYITASIADLKNTTPQISIEVSALKEEVAQYRKEIQKELTETAERGRSDRKVFLNTLHQASSQMLQEFNEFRKSISEDLNGIHKAWHGDMKTEKDKGTKEERIEFHPQANWDRLQKSQSTSFIPLKEIEEVAPPPAFEENATKETRDDLTLISGIGPERQNQLNASGVYTFSHLSDQNVDQLLPSLSKPLSKEEIQKWIDQAKELTFM